MENKVKKRLLTVREAAAYLGISESKIRRGIMDVTPYPFPIKPIRIGRNVRFDIQALDSYLEGE